DYVDARTLHAEVLVGLEDYATAPQDLDRALKIDPTAAPTLAVAAGVKYLTHDQAGFEAVKQRTLALYPKDAEFYTTLSELASQVRFYKGPAAFPREGATRAPRTWH